MASQPVCITPVRGFESETLDERDLADDSITPVRGGVESREPVESDQSSCDSPNGSSFPFHSLTIIRIT